MALVAAAVDITGLKAMVRVLARRTAVRLPQTASGFGPFFQFGGCMGLVPNELATVVVFDDDMVKVSVHSLCGAKKALVVDPTLLNAVMASPYVAATVDGDGALGSLAKRTHKGCGHFGARQRAFQSHYFKHQNKSCTD